MSACPICHRRGTLLLVVSSGFWERQILSRLGWNPYRCRVCGHRIRRHRRRDVRDRQQESGQEAQSATDGVVTASSGAADRFLQHRDDPAFDELIRQLAVAEQEQGLTAAQTGQPVSGKKGPGTS